MIRGADRDLRLAVLNRARRGISGNGPIWSQNLQLTFGAGPKNYQCHGTGGTGQMGALENDPFEQFKTQYSDQ